jgi:hypothetical protein
MTVTSSSLLDQLKRSGSIKAEEPAAAETVSQSLQLRDFLKGKK